MTFFSRPLPAVPFWFSPNKRTFALLRPFAPFFLRSFAGLRLRSFALFCAHVRVSANSQLPKGNHPRGTTPREAPEKICLPERSAGVSQRALRGLSEGYPILPFLVFCWKKHEKPPKKQGFFIPTEPLKSLEKKGKTLEKTRNSSQGKKTRNSKKTKERKDRVVRGLSEGSAGGPQDFPGVVTLCL